MSKSIRFEGENISPEKLPIPTGWRLVIGMIAVEEKTAGGIILTAKTIEEDVYVRCIGKVLSIGGDCYQHPKFQGGLDIKEHQPEKWVKVGDVVLVNAYVGMSVKLIDDNGNTQTVKILNDDEILSVIPDINHILT